MIALTDIEKSYEMGQSRVRALAGLSLNIAKGEYLAIMGPSGSGKSTLMNIIGCLDSPSSGSYRLNDREIARMEDDELARIRNREIGFIFQTFNLLSRSEAVRNVELPLIYSGLPKQERQARAGKALEMVGLRERMHHKPNEMSGGERQRVAIARALVTDPELILADEPTGNLDRESTEEIMELFGELNRSGRTIVLITHDLELASRCTSVLRIDEGFLTQEAA